MVTTATPRLGVSATFIHIYHTYTYILSLVCKVTYFAISKREEAVHNPRNVTRLIYTMSFFLLFV